MLVPILLLLFLLLRWTTHNHKWVSIFTPLWRRHHHTAINFHTITITVFYTVLTRLAPFIFWSRCSFTSGIWAPVFTFSCSSVGLDNTRVIIFLNFQTFGTLSPTSINFSHAGQALVEILVVKGTADVLIPTVAQSFPISVFGSSFRIKLDNQLAFRNLLVAFYKLWYGNSSHENLTPLYTQGITFPYHFSFCHHWGLPLTVGTSRLLKTAELNHYT